MRIASRPEMHVQTVEDGEQDVLSIRDLLGILRRRLWVIAVSAIAFTAIALGYSLTQTPQYEASARLLLQVQDDTVSGQQSPGSPESDAQAIEMLSETMAQGVQNEAVAEGVVQRLNLEMTPQAVLSATSVDLVPNTNLLDVFVTADDPTTARDIANAVAEEATEEEIPLNRTADNSLTATVWDEARVPAEPVEPQPLRDGLVGLVLGLMVGVGAVFLLEHLDRSVRSPGQAERVSGVPVLGAIPNQKLPKHGEAQKGGGKDAAAEADEALPSPAHSGLNGNLITTADPDGPAADAYRALRSMLLHASLDTSPKVVLLTGADGGKDEASTCANLGVALAQAGKRTVILDCGFRDFAVEKLFGIGEGAGLAEVLAGESVPEEVWSEPLAGLKVFPSGSTSGDPAALLESERFPELLAGLRERFDYVLIYAPPLGAASDTLTLSAYSDGVLLITRARETSADAVRQAVRGVQTVGSNVVGLVVNGVEAKGRRRPEEVR